MIAMSPGNVQQLGNIMRRQGYCDALLCRSQKKGMSASEDCDLVSGGR